jgi:hypothetical protein
MGPRHPASRISVEAKELSWKVTPHIDYDDDDDDDDDKEVCSSAAIMRKAGWGRALRQVLR